MKKTLRKIVPAIAMLLISATLVGTSTFAWFSMNNKVSITGMTVTTKVGSNLMIAADTLDSTAKKGDENFATAQSGAIAAQLEPVSTKTGKAFFYTTNALTTGDAAADDYVVYNAAEVPTSGVGSELEAFNTAYGTTGAVGYVDYVFQLKAVNADGANARPIKITKLNLVYPATDAGKAFRVAFFCEDITAGTATAGSGDLVGIYSPNGAANQSDEGGNNYAIGAAATAPTQLTANYNAATTLVSVDAGATKYYKVVARLYLEGEDTTCKNDVYATLTSSWGLDIAFALDTSAETNTNVSYISQYKVASLTIKSVASTDVLFDGTNVYLRSNMTQINSDASTIPTANLTDATELDALNTAFGTTFAFPV